MTIDIAQLQGWIGKTETRTEQVTAAPLAALASTLDRPDPEPRPGDPVPPLWHWLYFLPRDRQSDLAPDGHPRRGGFLPPVPLPRRMWAGDRLEFHRPLRVGETVTRTSRILDVQLKEGRTGPLVFVVVRHEIADAIPKSTISSTGRPPSPARRRRPLLPRRPDGCGSGSFTRMTCSCSAIRL